MLMYGVQGNIVNNIKFSLYAYSQKINVKFFRNIKKSIFGGNFFSIKIWLRHAQL